MLEAVVLNHSTHWLIFRYSFKVSCYHNKPNFTNPKTPQTCCKMPGRISPARGNLSFSNLLKCLMQLVCCSTDNLRNGLKTQANVYATSVIRFTLEPCNFTLNTFQDSVFTYFKQEQECECNYRLLKLFREINKAENHHLMFS